MKKFIFTPPPDAQVSGETPVAVRQAKSRQALTAAGGRRIYANLDADAVKDLESLKADWGLDNTRAIVEALRRVRRRH